MGRPFLLSGVVDRVTIVVGTAGWSIPTKEATRFPGEGSALERYAACFAGAEINSSFHRSHRPSTWQRWEASVPDHFRFSVKVPKTITHQSKLVDCGDLLAAHLAEARLLGRKLAVHLVQLPPSLAFDAAVAEQFFAMLGAASPLPVACEPRHPSWFEAPVEALFRRWRVARVAADPARVPAAAEPGGWDGLTYVRLHGSPVVYRSSYEGERLDAWAALLRTRGERPAWCIFDNTASSAATGNALDLLARLEL